MKILNYVLGLLPFNGDKTKIGVLLSLIAFLQAFLQTTDGQAIITMIFTQPLDWVALATLLVGVLHKYLKAKEVK